MDYVWVILCSALVFLMQAGFMALESGMGRAKNSINIAIKNLADFILSVAGFWLVGFGLMFGVSWNGLFGTTDYVMSISDDPWRALFFVFQAVFAGTAATIDSGAVAERTKFSAYLILSFFTCAIIYPVFGHWAWGGFFHEGQAGWLQSLGFLDFAGSTVVHSIGGWVALAGVILVGPRIGRFGPDGKPQKLAPHNLVSVYLGTFILFFGWFGFNAGSTLAATPDIAGIVLNTLLGAAFGAIAAGALSWVFSPSRHPEAEMIANGVLAGLVAVTAGCAYVETGAAALIGLVAGVLVYGGTWALERLGLDDVVGAFPVHGLCGIWGTLAVGFFITDAHLAATSGLDRLSQIGVQALGVGAAFLWAFPLALGAIWLLKKTIGMRVSAADEQRGLNVAEHGATMSILGLAESLAKLRKSPLVHEGLKVEVETGTEVGELAGYFNEMIDTLIQERARLDLAKEQQQKAWERMKEFSRSEHVLKDSLEKQKASSDKELRAFGVSMEQHVERIRGSLSQVEQQMETTDSVGRAMTEVFSAVSDQVGRLLASFQAVEDETRRSEGAVSEGVKAALTSRAEVQRLEESAKRIGEVIGLLEDLSEQTKVLAVNAAIEAARAGTAGRSFKVVADQVKHLAESSSASGQRVVEYLKAIQAGTQATARDIRRLEGVMGEVQTLQSALKTHVGQETEVVHQVRRLVGSAVQTLHDLTEGVQLSRHGAQTAAADVQESLDELKRLLA